MELAFLFNHINFLLLLAVLCAPCKFIQGPMDFGSSSLQQATPTSSLDYGRIYFNSPAAVLRPKSPEAISTLLKFLYGSSFNDVAVAARGAGHSIHGQAQALNGIVIEMDSLPSSIEIRRSNGDNGIPYADVSGGTLWIDLLKECLRVDLAPKSWTDYLYLTIGGTLSNGGISGQTFKNGPQVTNVLELDVVTGKGELLTCSTSQNSDLFFAVLGGLGQFGIITRARIMLEEAPQKVKWVRVFYDDFEKFTRDQELLVTSMEAMVDYVEGFIVLNDHSLLSSFVSFPSNLDLLPHFHEGSSDIHYCIEFAVYCHQTTASNAEKAIEEEILRRLSHIPSLVYSVVVSYFDFLNRVRMEEENLRGRGLWDVPHPWLNMFVPPSSITHFKDLLLQSISPEAFEGPVLIYPLRIDKWNGNMSVVVPETDRSDNLVYIVGVLRSVAADCVTGTPCLGGIVQQNQRVVEAATAELSAKQYLPSFSSERQWRNHFGEGRWQRFAAMKARFDPLHMLAPGQRIFDRIQQPSSASAGACDGK
ncbi:Cytokinin dehydrogenase 3 [Nymphaea thermarum]|nr:Cytokinin dehydrogenase 3 [Nymphaea thermarum]